MTYLTWHLRQVILKYSTNLPIVICHTYTRMCFCHQCTFHRKRATGFERALAWHCCAFSPS